MSRMGYPNESAEYREARDRLLESEIALRARIEEVARQRRALPPGGALREDYRFTERHDGVEVARRLSELFGDGRDTLVLYSFMYAPEMEAPCPMCSAMLDGLDAQAPHILQHVDLAVAAKHELDAIHAHADARGWSNLRLLSSAGSRYNLDYYGEVDGHQMPTANVFVRDATGIHHFWGSELVLAESIEGGNMRHLDLIWPLWNVLDMTPAGRPDWYPRLDYRNDGSNG